MNFRLISALKMKIRDTKRLIIPKANMCDMTRIGDMHTNGIENVWSLFKRSIVGAFHHISEKP